MRKPKIYTDHFQFTLMTGCAALKLKPGNQTLTIFREYAVWESANIKGYG